MPARWLKRITEGARATYVLTIEWLQYIVGYSPVDINPGPSWLLGAGVNAQLNDSNPQLITVSPALPFNSGHIGKYILLYGAVNSRNIGVFKITAVPSTTQLLVVGGTYGANFTTELNVHWRLLDQDALAAAGADQQAVLGAPTGSGSTPNWQVLLTLPASPSVQIRVSGQPFGAWNNVGHAAFLGFVNYNHVADSTPKWYFYADDTMLLGWTENNAGTDVTSMFYVGSIQAFVPTSDPSPVVQWGGTTTTFLTNGRHVAADGSTLVASKAIKLQDRVAGADWFAALPQDPLDLRSLGVGIIVGSDAAGNEEIRGVLRNMYRVSDVHTYKRFISNNRRLLSLGGSIAIVWNGDLVV